MKSKSRCVVILFDGGRQRLLPIVLGHICRRSSIVVCVRNSYVGSAGTPRRSIILQEAIQASLTGKGTASHHTDTEAVPGLAQHLFRDLFRVPYSIGFRIRRSIHPICCLLANPSRRPAKPARKFKNSKKSVRQKHCDSAPHCHSSRGHGDRAVLDERKNATLTNWLGCSFFSFFYYVRPCRSVVSAKSRRHKRWSVLGDGFNGIQDLTLSFDAPSYLSPRSR